MEKALLIALSTDKFGYVQRRPILGLLYISCAIESKKVHCEILDQQVDSFSVADLIRRLKRDDYIFVGFYSQSIIKERLTEYIKKVKQGWPRVKIIVGGPGCVFYREFLSAGCDIVCRGEADLTITEIIDYLRQERKIDDIEGIAYIKNGRVIENRERVLIKDLDSLSFPSRDKIKTQQYYDYSVLPLKAPFAPVVASRGCPYKCTFCFSCNFWRNQLRIRSVTNLLCEIDILVNDFGVRYIIFQDDVFGIDNDWLREFCVSLIARGYRNLRWMCILHPLTFKKDAAGLIRLMKKAGCNLFLFGLQSVTPVILEKINRSANEPDALRHLIKRANRAGIMTHVDFIIGLPGETRQTCLENIKFSLTAKPHLVNFHPLFLEPGSELEREYKGNKICNLSEQEIKALCLKANKRFYFQIQNLMRIIMFILRNNPALLFKTKKLLALFIERLFD